MSVLLIFSKNQHWFFSVAYLFSIHLFLPFVFWLQYLFTLKYFLIRASPVAHLVKNLPTMWETLGLIPGSGRSPGEGKGYPLQYSSLENSTDCIVHGIAKSWTQLSDFHFISLHFLIKLELHWSYVCHFATVSPLHMNIHIVSFQRCKRVFAYPVM